MMCGLKDRLKAKVLGSKGGRASSLAKRIAARANGRKGGRPKKDF